MSNTAAAVQRYPDTHPCESILRYEHALPGQSEIHFKSTVATFTENNNHSIFKYATPLCTQYDVHTDVDLLSRCVYAQLYSSTHVF
jgi:hypothetical protein